MPPCLTLSNIRFVSRVKWSNPEKGVEPSSTPRCSSYWKGSLLVALDYGRQQLLHRHTQTSGRFEWCNVYQNRLANFHKWVRVSWALHSFGLVPHLSKMLSVRVCARDFLFLTPPPKKNPKRNRNPYKTSVIFFKDNKINSFYK